MIRPLFIEHIRKLIVGHFIIRFWFKTVPGKTSGSDADSWIRGLSRSINPDLGIESDVAPLAKYLCEYFPEDTLSAFEITTHDGNGIVVYVEWP